jgi:signal transduction histidine kinase
MSASPAGAHDLTHAMGGTLEVRSEIDRGAIFTARLAEVEGDGG